MNINSKLVKLCSSLNIVVKTITQIVVKTAIIQNLKKVSKEKKLLQVYNYTVRLFLELENQTAATDVLPCNLLLD